MSDPVRDLFSKRPSTDESGSSKAARVFDDLFGASGEVETSDASDAAEEPERREAEKNGLAHLVLTVVQLLHEVLERQAIRRMENGSLTDEQVEEIGRTLMRQSEELDRLCEEFEIEPDELEIPLDGVRAID